MSRSTWTAEELEQLKRQVATGKTARELEPLFNCTRKRIIDAVRKYDLGPWIPKPGTTRGDTSHVPDDFADRWQTTSLEALADHYGRGIATVRQWAALHGLSRPRGSHLPSNRPNPLPANFAQMQAGYTIQQLMAHYRVGRDVMRRWMKEAGIKRDRFQQPLRMVKPNAYATAPVDRPHRDASRAGMAASFMQRQGWIVYRCDDMGRQLADGPKWRCGTVTITDADLIARAERKGWDADAWKRVA